MTEPTSVLINGDLPATLVAILMRETTGPREAFSTLCVAILMVSELNNQQLETPMNRAQIAEETKKSILSIKSDNGVVQ